MPDKQNGHSTFFHLGGSFVSLDVINVLHQQHRYLLRQRCVHCDPVNRLTEVEDDLRSVSCYAKLKLAFIVFVELALRIAPGCAKTRWRQSPGVFEFVAHLSSCSQSGSCPYPVALSCSTKASDTSTNS